MSSRKKPEDLLDRFSPEVLTKIVPTKAKRGPDVFDSYRPPNVETMIDYNISETRLKCRYKGAQLDIRKTEASYLPKSEKDIEALKRKKRIVYSHVGPPKWKFVDEVWKERQAETQVVHRKNFEKLHERNRRAFSKSGWSRHKKAQRLAGPIWYQELSPKQLFAVNSLKNSLETSTDTFKNVKEDLARLGLVPRPSSRAIHCALRYSCGKPVEFFLALYQLTKLDNAKYSVNDRLILSSVVHLTISDTLKELHKRIPSPPRCYCEKPRKVKVARRKVKCKSPYLEPYTFKPEPAKFTGAYYDKHVQYPESPYFSYLFELYAELSLSGNVSDIDLNNITDEERRQLIEETIAAQDMYAQLHCWQNVQFLVPTVVKCCGNYEAFLRMQQDRETRSGTLILPSLATLEPLKEPECTCREFVEDIEVCCKATTNCDCDECQCRTKTMLFVSRLCERCERKEEERTYRNFVEGMVAIRCDLSLPVIGGTFTEPTCNCMEMYRNRLKIFEVQDMLRCQRVKYVITGGVVVTKVGAVYCIFTAVLNSRLRRLYASQQQTSHTADESSGTDNDKTDKVLCTCKTQGAQCDVNGVEREKCSCCACEVSSESSTVSSDPQCRCMQALKDVLEHKCTCEACIRETRDPTFIINDTVDTEEVGPCRVIEGVHEQHCDCLSKHLEKIKMLEEYKKRAQARFQLRKQIHKYSVGGVCNTPLGPVYAISDVRQPVRCICAELFEEREKLEKESSTKPERPPEGRVTYGITGVAHGRDRNVFVYDQAMLAENCPCEVLFDKFMQDHGSCLKSFDEYLKTMAQEIKYYKEEMGIAGSVSTGSGPGSSFEEGGAGELIDSRGEDSSASPVESTGEKESSTSDEKRKSCCCQCTSGSEESVVFDSSYQIQFEPEVSNPRVDKLVDEFEEKSSDHEVNTSRFIILKSFPKNGKKLLEVLKRALDRLAEDGFPLAKLPGCYKLPHFRLWLQMRTGKKWTRVDRNRYLPVSSHLYEHVSLCYKDTRIPDLSAIRKAKHLTWTTANFWREYAQRKKLCFYRDLKHCLIENTRELYPTRFAYEFYTAGYRDCFFAYTGGKEEDLFPYLD